MRTYLLTATALVAAFATAAFPAEQRVSTSGTDSADCSVIPCATLEQAVTNAASGDQIRIASGQYRLAAALTIDSGTFALSISGGWDDDFNSQNSGRETVLQHVPGRTVLNLTSTGTAVLEVDLDRLVFRRVAPHNDYGAGSLLAAVYSGGSTLNLTVTDSRFEGNEQGFGGAISLTTYDGVLNAAVERSEFSRNRSTSAGGAIWAEASNGTLDLRIEDSTFVKNRAGTVGGAIALNSDGDSGVFHFSVQRSLFVKNVARLAGGGAIASLAYDDSESTHDIDRVVFSRNSSRGKHEQYPYYSFSAGGGALLLYQAGATSSGTHATLVRNSFFARNSAQEEGGAIASRNGRDNPTSLELRNVSMTGNRSDTDGGALSVIDQTGMTSAVVSNSILWGNAASSGQDFSLSAGSTVNNTDYGSGIGPFADGGGNLSVDPLFVDASKADLHLEAASTLRDAGDCLEAGDIDGDSRPIGLGCDIGADEVSP